MLFFGGRGFAAPFRSAGGCFLIRGGLSAALPLVLTAGAFFVFPLFPLSRRGANYLSPPSSEFPIPPSLLFGTKNELFMSPLPFGGGDIWCFVLPPLFGEGRSVFRGRRKGVGVLGKTRDLLRTETNLKKSRRLLPPRARMSGRAAPPSEREARGCLPAPQIRCARKREDRCRVLKYWRAFPPSRR